MIVVIAGKNDIAIHGLKLALKSFPNSQILAVPNSSDTGVNGWQRSFLNYAIKNNVKIKKLSEIYDQDISIFISLEFDQIVDPHRIRSEKIFNIHFSLLPKYKGMYTSVWPVLFGDDQSGVTLHEIDAGIDTGDIVDQVAFNISDTDRSQDLYRKYLTHSVELLSKNFTKIISNECVEAKKQSCKGSTYFSKNAIDFSNLKIDFNKTAWEVVRQVYAFSFRPYQLIKFNGRCVANVKMLDEKSEKRPGAILEENHYQSIVSTVDYDVCIVFDRLDQLLEEIPIMTLDSFIHNLDATLGVNDRNERGWSPIIVAAYHGRIDIVEYLLENNANINDINYKGTSVLMYAKDYCLRVQDSSLMKYLISKGANKHITDYSGKSVFDYITRHEAGFLGLRN